jgi:hypothetical protein
MKTLLFSLFLVVSHTAFAQECFLQVTNGGGITGAATVYQIHLDGKVLKGNGLGTIHYQEKSNLKKSKAKKFFRKTRQLLTSLQEHNFPGNIYYSLALKENDKQMKITWGDAGHPAPAQAMTLYDEITDVLSHLTFRENNTP